MAEIELRRDAKWGVVELVGLSTDVKPANGAAGSTFYETDTGNRYIYTGSAWVLNYALTKLLALPGTVQADILAIREDIATIKAQDQIAKLASHSFVFDEDDLTKSVTISYNGLVKHLHLVAPNFTNPVTVTLSLRDGSGRILWTSAAKAENASYNLETEAEWFDQLVTTTLSWVVTLSGVAGGTGGTVTLIPRYYGG